MLKFDAFRVATEIVMVVDDENFCFRAGFLLVGKGGCQTTYAATDNDFVDFVVAGTTWSSELKTKELVLGVFNGSTAAAYPLEALAAQGNAVVVNDVVSSTPIVVTYRSDGNVAIAFERVVNGQTLTFDVTSEIPFGMVDTETGTEWNSRGEGVAGTLSGQQLTPVEDAFVAFWFAWSLYYPSVKVFTF